MSDDGNWTELDAVTVNQNAEMPRSIARNDIVGSLYNWFSSTAESGNVTNTPRVAEDSICPTGWKLPSRAFSDTDSWYNLLLTSYEYISSTNENSANISELKRTPFLFVQTSRYTYSDGTFASRPWSMYQTNQSHSLGQYQYFLGAYYDTTNINVDDSGGRKSHGIAIRCVKR